MKPASKRVAQSQAKAKEQGAERLTLTLYGEDAEAWRELLARQPPGHGAKMDAFRAAVYAALERRPLSRAALLAEIERRLT